MDVRPAGLDADFADHRQRRVPHALVLAVGQRLGRRDGDAVPGVDAHRVEVLDRTNDDDVVVRVPHHLHLVFLPTDDRFLDQDLGGRRLIQPVFDHRVEFVLVVRDAAARPAHRERRPDDRRQAHLRQRLAGGFDRLDDVTLADVQPDLFHRLFEPIAGLGLVDHVGVGGDHLDAVLLQHAVFGQCHREVQPRLAAQRRQHRVGAFLGDDLFDHLPRQRFDVRRIGGGRVGHDGRRVAVDQHDLVPLLPQRLARLGAGIIELARLPDHDGAAADEKDLVQVVAAGHGRRERRGAEKGNKFGKR